MDRHWLSVEKHSSPREDGDREEKEEGPKGGNEEDKGKEEEQENQDENKHGEDPSNHKEKLNERLIKIGLEREIGLAVPRPREPKVLGKELSQIEDGRRKGELLSKPETRREWTLFFHEYRKVKQRNERLKREKEEAIAKKEQTTIALQKTKRTKWILEKDHEILQNQHSSLFTAHKSNLSHIERMEGTLALFNESPAITHVGSYAKRCRSLRYTDKDQHFIEHFSLPSTEFQIDTFFASYEGKWGYLYVSPAFLCFDEGWSPTKLPSGTPHILTKIKNVIRVNKTKALYVAEAVGLLLSNGEDPISLFFLNSSSPFVETLVVQAKKFGVDLDVTQKNFPGPSSTLLPPPEDLQKGGNPPLHRPALLTRSTTPPPLPTTLHPTPHSSLLAPPSRSGEGTSSSSSSSPHSLTVTNSSSLAVPDLHSSINSSRRDYSSRPRSSSSHSSSSYSSPNSFSNLFSSSKNT